MISWLLSCDVLAWLVMGRECQICLGMGSYHIHCNAIRGLHNMADSCIRAAQATGLREGGLDRSEPALLPCSELGHSVSEELMPERDWPVQAKVLGIDAGKKARADAEQQASREASKDVQAPQTTVADTEKVSLLPIKRQSLFFWVNFRWVCKTCGCCAQHS